MRGTEESPFQSSMQPLKFIATNLVLLLAVAGGGRVGQDALGF